MNIPKLFLKINMVMCNLLDSLMAMNCQLMKVEMFYTIKDIVIILNVLIITYGHIRVKIF